ncbi:MAG: ABC transporter ATP-binding protein [Ignavibacteriae bacterium]|nr:ABC transporter ATP-binding protein [Ignavibacteria bacterium]MBI3363886.1 ABC transporter ATP-binding protein [Ignavibacteriota bacterium]
MSDVAIEVKDLTKKFGNFTAVDHIDFTVKQGEVFGFLGANGAGKSTTIRMLCGLLQSTSGTASVGGYDINTQTELLKRNIGYMSQKFSLYDDLTVEQNIRFFGGVYGLKNDRLKERIRWVLDMADLTGREQSLTKTLSGGWKQRLALGCAILHEPKIVFLDEPTGGVDPISRRKFWDLINQLSSQGITVLVTTHFLDEAEYCNDIILINAGRLIASGSPGELKTQHIRKPILEVACDGVVRALERVRVQPWAIETSIFGTLLHVMVENENEGKRVIRELLASASITVERIDRIVPSLEDVFLYLLERDSNVQAGKEVVAAR